MRILKKLLAPREVRAFLGVLDEADYRFGSEAFRRVHSNEEANYWFNYEAFRLVRSIIENAALADTGTVATRIRGGLSPREYVYTLIANVSGDHVTSGRYHLYRGILNPLNIGGSLLQIFDTAEDELATIGAMDQEYAEEQKKGVREQIRTVG